MGRHLYGIACLLLGASSLALHDQLVSDWQLPGETAFIVVTSIAQMIGGTAVQIPRTVRLGAATLGVVYVVFALTFVPSIWAEPGVYASWGNVFYQLPLVAGAIVTYYSVSPSAPYAKSGCKAAVVALGLSSISFAVEQFEFLGRTTSLVPKWIPLGAMFWAVATGIAFGLAGVSIVSGYRSPLASRLLGSMLAIFGCVIWIPSLIADAKTHSNWSEGIETFAIAGASWIVADFLSTIAPPKAL